MIQDEKMRGFLKFAAMCCGAAFLYGAPAAADTTYQLTNPQLIHLFPNAADPAMPSFYANQAGFPQTLAQSIQLYTQQSLANDGINYSSVNVTVSGNTANVTIAGSDPRASSYAAMMAGLVAAGTPGWNGTLACQAVSGCWGNPVSGGQPWAFYLPLGLPMVNQVAVTFLDYPPNASLCTSNYLSNFTTARWNAVMTTAGVTNPVLYEAIVDAHPIAAPGSGQGTYVDATTSYFGGNQGYDNTLLGVLTNPPTNTSATSTLPVLVLGTPARGVWGQLINYQNSQTIPVPVNAAGTATLPGQKKFTKWVAGNHPDVTTYQCCPGDPTKSCKGSYSLVADEIIDLTVACTIKALADNPDADPVAAQATCSTNWNSAAQKHAVCAQARLDYDFMSSGMPCKCQAAADKFCSDNADNACATDSNGVPKSCSAYAALCNSTSPATTPPKYQYPGCATQQ